MRPPHPAAAYTDFRSAVRCLLDTGPVGPGAQHRQGQCRGRPGQRGGPGEHAPDRAGRTCGGLLPAAQPGLAQAIAGCHGGGLSAITAAESGAVRNRHRSARKPSRRPRCSCRPRRPRPPISASPERSTNTRSHCWWASRLPAFSIAAEPLAAHRRAFRSACHRSYSSAAPTWLRTSGSWRRPTPRSGSPQRLLPHTHLERRGRI